MTREEYENLKPKWCKLNDFPCYSIIHCDDKIDQDYCMACEFSQTSMQKFVLGFAFNTEKTHVLLIKKNRPSCQKGYLNGLGGKVEDGEHAVFAMRREFFEECGIKTELSDWYSCGHLTDNKDYYVMCMALVLDDLEQAQTLTDEEVLIVSLNELDSDKCFGNLVELIDSALKII